MERQPGDGVSQEHSWMDWFWRLIQHWRARGQGTVERIVLLEFAGLEPAAADRYLEQGLLHYLALLGDVGTQSTLLDSPTPLAASSVCNAARQLGARCVELLPLQESAPADIAEICLADRQQQERMIAALTRKRRGLVVCVFDMPARLQQLFGPQPDEAQGLMIRDVYARMDEIVGKALSFVDARTELFVAIRGTSGCGGGNDAQTPGLLFASCRMNSPEMAAIDLPAAILGRLGRSSKGA